ncbi:hypothetical protein DNTS_004180 [Danionella cerebrum]|uniref:G-protein coupled receptors family 2 profile 2 domain-containing protein n=1 Tax=Danionella cerebrum TaxID=2873325 RepID=A0A553QYP7_9TELE|nr:hypothetical protein DNTS_004180 [Danionella translucida]
MAHKTTVLVFVFLSMIFGMDAKSVLQKIQTVHGIRINISLEDGTNFTLLDYGKELKCTSNRVFTCYAECSKNFDDNDKEEHEITVTSDKQMGRMHFTFGPNSSNCTIYQCSYLWVVHMLTQKEMNLQLPIDLLYIQRIKQMCREETLNLTVVDLYIRVEKKALNALINMTSDYSTTYNSEDLSMNVLKINLSSPDSYMRIPVPPVKLKDKTVYSKIIRIEVPDREVNKLSNLLKIAFSVNNTSYLSKNYTLSCEFYDEKGDNTWKNDGCSTRKINESLVECNCDHMTPFALLLIQLDISPIQWEVLSYISYVGCSLSAFFSAVTVFAFIFNSTAREASNYIHVSLSGSLFILNVSFMFAEWAATLTMKDVCVLVAVIIHYSLLSSFTWMAIEAFHLYLLLIRVFNIYIKHYTVKLSIVGWGIPAVVIGALLSVYKIKPFYGFTEWTLTDTNTTNAVCWIKEPIVFYGVNLVYFTVIFLLNLGILITVTTQIFQLKRTRSKNGKLPVWKDAVTVLGLMCILGTTWGLAFFSSGKTVYPILYLFCIFNSMQGRILHLCMDVLFNDKIKCTNIGVPEQIHSRNLQIRTAFIHETLFRVSPNADTKGNETNESETMLHGKSALGIWLGNKEIHKLSQPIQLKFQNAENKSGNGICVFWKMDENGRVYPFAPRHLLSGNWSTDGCETSMDNTDFVCSCNHLSFFAVLISPQIPEESHIFHLSYISYIGSGFSVAFTSFMIILKKQRDHSVFIHVQLSGSLLLLHIFFLCSVWLSPQRDIDVVCQALGLTLHWSLLATFTWTAIEGFHLYLLLVRVFNIYIKKYQLKLSLVGWGVPTVTVIVCAVTKGYGKYSFYMDKDNSKATSLCWMTSQTLRFTTINAYLGLVLLFNTVMLVVMVVKMRKLRLQVKDQQKKAWQDWVTLLGFCCILGVPWGLAFFTHGPLSLPALYIFNILNSLQGVFISFWFMTLMCKVKKQKQFSSEGTIKTSFQSHEDCVNISR